MDDKLDWIFRLYDINNRGSISRKELYSVIKSIYDMMGKNTNPPLDESSVLVHVSEIFEVDFLRGCPKIRKLFCLSNNFC